jgi:hypothetical protein
MPMLTPAHTLSADEKLSWYDAVKECHTLPDELMEEVRFNKEAEYDIGELPDWVVYRRALDQANSWNEIHNEDEKFVVVLCSRTFFILTIKDYEKLKG